MTLRSSEVSTGTQSSSGTQSATQSGGNKVSIDTFVDKFIEHGKKLESKRKTGKEQQFIANIKAVVRQVAEERRRERVFNFLRSSVDKDQATKLTEFYSSWCQLTSLLEEDHVSCRLAGLRLVLEVLSTQPIISLYVSSLYDQFVKQVQLCDSGQILLLLETQSGSLVIPNLSDRWRDCSLVLLKQLLKHEEITKDGNIENSAVFVRNLILEWMTKAASFETFGAIVTIVQSLTMDDLIEKFLDECALEDVLDVERRPILTSKCISLLRVVDNKRLLRVLREIISAWSKKSGVAPAVELMPCVSETVKVAKDHPNIGRTFVNLYKNEPGVVMCSEFGFLLVFALCSIDRYKTLIMTELTKVFQKLWSFRENVCEFGWIKNSGLGEVVDIVEDQVTCLLQRLGDDVEAFNLLSDSTIVLLQSLLNLPSMREVIIVDGRVADGCPIWLFASKVLAKLIISRRKDIGTHLAMIIEMVTTSSTSISFVYIDMLVEIVRSCTLEVLNNWRELEILFRNICYIRRDISVSLVRCFMPVINNRSQLREQLLQSVKGNLLDSRHASAVVPILMLIFRSFTKLPKVVTGSQMSQSFATFSSQSLKAMGCTRRTDETVCLEVVGLLKRCLTQSTSTKTAVYLGFAEEGKRNSAMAGQCLDLLVSHATTTPEWKAETMCLVAGGVVTLVEPLPHLVQLKDVCVLRGLLLEKADGDLVLEIFLPPYLWLNMRNKTSERKAMQCLLSEDIVADVAPTQTQIGATIHKSANDILDSWVLKASSEDVHDLGIDKLSEWNPAIPLGCTNILFARMMLNMYDVLIEREWEKFYASQSVTNVDHVIALLGRRKELEEVLLEKYLRRKESKVGTTEGGPTVDLKQAEVLINCCTIMRIFETIVPPESSSLDVLSEVHCELLDWAIDRILSLSKSLLHGFHPLHSVLCGTNALICSAGFLLDYYTSTNCVDWIESCELASVSKTKALEAYANIIQYLSTKYRCQPSKVLSIWKRSDLNATSTRGGEKTLTVNGSLVRHCHLFVTKLLPAILLVDRKEGEERKRIGVELERQAKHMFKICAALMKMMDNSKCFMTMFKFTLGILEKNIIANNVTLRDLLKWLCNLALKCIDVDHEVERASNAIADNLVQVLSEEGDECKYKFVEHASKGTVCDFLASLIDRSLVGVRALISFAGAFQAKDQRMDEVLTTVLEKCDHCCQLTARLLPLHSQFAVERERIVQTLTALFSATQEPVDVMLSYVKTVPQMVEWKSLTLLANLIKERLQPIMAIADEHVGIFNPDEARSDSKKSVRKNEMIYVKYVRAREALQSQILLISEALKEDRLNFQVKKNTIGMRDFRINLKTLKTRVVQRDEELPKGKKRKTLATMQRSEEQENEELVRNSDEEDDTMDGDLKDISEQSVVF